MLYKSPTQFGNCTATNNMYVNYPEANLLRFFAITGLFSLFSATVFFCVEESGTAVFFIDKLSRNWRRSL